jgi:predicted nicotinamide N-methyase
MSNLLVLLALWFASYCDSHESRGKSPAFVHNSQRLPRKNNCLSSPAITATATIATFLQCGAVAPRHTVQGIECVEVTLNLPLIRQVTVLEATAESQEVLVNLALEDDASSNLRVAQHSLKSGDPYGAVLWPASLAIASYILTNVNVRDQTVLELGAGTGLVSLAACGAGALSVTATDYESIPLQLLEFAAAYLNPALDIDMDRQLHCQLLDLCDTTAPLPAAAWVVAADIMYEPVTGRAVAVRALEALERGSHVLIGDSPGRAGRPAFLEELARLGVEHGGFVDTVGSTVTGARHELICGKGSTTVSLEPQALTVAIMELDPALHLPKSK